MKNKQNIIPIKVATPKLANTAINTKCLFAVAAIEVWDGEDVDVSEVG
ncbi:6629_t:CDS:1, partial [Acaulospora colombiana]